MNNKKPNWRCETELWSINRWLRWTGIRLFVSVDNNNGEGRLPTKIGFVWWGWKWLYE